MSASRFGAGEDPLQLRLSDLQQRTDRRRLDLQRLRNRLFAGPCIRQPQSGLVLRWKESESFGAFHKATV